MPPVQHSADLCYNTCRSVAVDLLQRYLEVEEVFQADSTTEQEVIDSLRKACSCTGHCSA